MYVIAGVTGNTGKAAAEALLQAGRPVKVIVRSAEKGAPWKAKGAEVAVADLGDEAALTAALKGAEGAYLLLPPDPTLKDAIAERLTMVETHRRALVAAGVKNVVYLSSVAAQLESGTGPIRMVHNAEKLLGDLPGITFLRADYFMENWASAVGPARGGVLPTFNPTNPKQSMIATRDIGALAAELLQQPAQGRPKFVELTGPEAYDPADVAAIFGELLGRKVEVQAGPPSYVSQTLQGFGFGKSMADLYQEFTVGLHEGRIVFEGTPRRGTTPLKDVLRGLLG